MDYINENDLLNETQHGFIRSCLANLLQFIEKITDYVDEGYLVNVIFLDVQKRSIKYYMQGCYRKLMPLELGGEVSGWIGSWLEERKQCVVINGKCSR